ncbi:MAG TPA: STAS/SEC14 domain-containing protein [Candidatus Thermoplasmatota archaeon]|nr:STAS/SEC14 domain-containing protein [Candidatus Thermoplasmatota archaeon]
MSHATFLDEDGRIVVVVRGDQIAAGIREMGRQVKALAEAAGSPASARILVDLSLVGQADADARRAGSQLLHTIAFGRAGLFGAKPIPRHFTNLMLLAARMTDRIRLFETREEARRWVDEIRAPAAAPEAGP